MLHTDESENYIINFLSHKFGSFKPKKARKSIDPLNPYRFSRKASDHGHMNGTNKGFKRGHFNDYRPCAIHFLRASREFTAKKKLPLLEYCVNFMREWMQINYKWTNLDHARRLKGCEHKHKGKAHDKDIPHPYIVRHLVEEVTMFIACYPRKVEVMISSTSF